MQHPLRLRLFMQRFKPKNPKPGGSFSGKEVTAIEAAQTFVINLEGCIIEQLDLTGLVNIPSLFIVLNHANFSEANVKFPNVSHLKLSVPNCLIDLETFQRLVSIPNLRVLYAASNPLLSHIDSLEVTNSSLIYLDLTQCNISNLNLQKLAQNFPKLESVVLTSNNFKSCKDLIGDFSQQPTYGYLSKVQFSFYNRNRTILCEITNMFQDR